MRGLTIWLARSDPGCELPLRRQAVCAFSASARPLKIVVVGDDNNWGKRVALSEACPAKLERLLRSEGVDATVVNAGRNGARAIDVLANLAGIVPADTDVAVVPSASTTSSMITCRLMRRVRTCAR